MKKFFILLIVLVGIGGLFLGSINNEPLKHVTNSVHGIDGIAKKRSFEIHLNVVGVLDAAKAHMISSNMRDAKGKIISLIDDGVRVAKGDVLLQLDPAPYEKQVKKLEAEVASLSAAVEAARQAVEFEKNQVDREIANAKYNRNVAVLEYRRIKEGDGPLKLSALQEEKDKAKLELQRHEAFYVDLLELKKEGFDNPSEIASEKEQVAIYKEQYQTAKKRYSNYAKHVLPALLEGAQAKKENTTLTVTQIIQGGKYKIAKAEANLTQAKSKHIAQVNALKLAIEELAKTTVTAPLDGIVIHSESFREGQKRKPRIGDTLFPSQPVLYLPDISKMIVKSRVREIDLHKLELGQLGVVTVDAYPEDILSGRLIFIGALATNQGVPESPEKFFQISFELTDSNMKLRPGMTCRVHLISKKYDNVLSIPLQAVFQEGGRENGKKYCYLNKGISGYVKQYVETGGENEDYVQILSGLELGDKVSLQPLDNI